MSPDILFGLGSGAAVGAANAVASYLLYRGARFRSDVAFYRLVLGGMVVRLAAVLVIVALVVWLAPVDVSAFIGALLTVFVVGLAADIAYIAKRPAHGGG
jgi:hypothetical protein